MSKQYIRIERSLLLHGNEFALSLDAMLLYAMPATDALCPKETGCTMMMGASTFIARKSAAKMVGCSVRKAVALFKALGDAGLIREVATGGSRRIYVKQWSEPSVLPSAESLRDGGFFDVTIDRVHVMPENYITIDVAMLASNISNRAKVLYALLSDASSKQRLYGRDVCSLPVRQRCLCCSAVATRSARPMRSWKRLVSSAAPAARATAASVLYPSLLIVGRFVHQAPR